MTLINQPHRSLPVTAGRIVLACALVLLAAPGAEAACLDDDGDGYTTCQNDCDDGNANVNPGLDDDGCDGLDNDCNGLPDDGYIPVPTTCGIGPCFNNGKVWCIGGVLTDSCTPKASSPDDSVCNGQDDDCDGSIDEDFVNATVTCGFGTCQSTGTVSCVDGAEESTCVPTPPEGVDNDCDGFDDDCDGLTDEHWAVQTTWCGQGACIESGKRKCVDGSVVDTCTPSAPSNDNTCDGVDDDCDGSIDEHFTPIPVTCGEGPCSAEGSKICDDGDLVTQCEPIIPEGGDNDCDGFDDDCDGWPDDEYIAPPTTCGVGACASAGKARCIEGAIEDTCEPGIPAAQDTTCDGVDDDCDGETDEDYVSVGTTCGVGGCVATGSTSCVGGTVIDVCTPGTPADNDASCDGVDDDCDGWPDEDFVPIGTTCGSGACADAGNILCVQGQPFDTCDPNGGADEDLSCDGIDDDCDGETDEDYVGQPVSCGTGACVAEGITTCVGGVVLDVCTPGVPAELDTLCNGIDDDCDGPVDEEWVNVETFCGFGACAAEGALVCTDGAIVDTCVADLGQAQDVYCDGIDNDCDGLVDEEFVSEATTCGVGACQAEGATVCDAGVVVDVCAPAEPSGLDDDCDGVDDDCDGFADDAWVIEDTSCGVFACASTGKLQCVSGEVTDTCTPMTAADSDSVCDGFDEDCDGMVDEDWAPEPITCGVGACLTEGSATCEAGTVVTVCEPSAPGSSDITCDGVDDDCNGVVDDAYTPTPTVCGVGACLAEGSALCEDGVVFDTCTPGPAAETDLVCDGIDENCDGAVDEGWTPEPITCGVGTCQVQVESTCVDGVESTSCQPGVPRIGVDTTCDGMDDDCDGMVDEDHVPLDVSCGIGACLSVGQAICDGGAVVEVCTPGAPADTDDTCDTVDDDCDGVIDDDVLSATTTCGTGACAATGDLICQDGAMVDTCAAGAAAPVDGTCDGVDDDCDGATDDDWIPTPTACGVGACASEGETVCEGGAVEDTCVAVDATDELCNGVDDDCDGVVDESQPTTTTSCGVGACASEGQEICQDGAWVDTCAPTAPGPDDIDCDGVDDDCDGQVDEDVIAQTTSCGEGACAASGELLCEDAQWIDTCAPGAPSATESCNGVDDDCDGAVDEDVTPTPTTCGTGACAAEGQSVCEDGAQVDTCAPGAAADEICNGVDDDCNGAVDDIDPVTITCGVGACATPGERSCVDGALVDTCAPDLASAEICNGVDDDCDGDVDEDVVPTPTTCGTGACAAEGESFCVDGALVDTCEAAPPAVNDVSCDGIDDDCDGQLDEDFTATETSCGQGACAAAGEQTCEAGVLTDTCSPGAPAATDGCDGVDNDCDGQLDEDTVPTPTSCGTGACAAEGESICEGGALVDTCVPGAAGVETCNGLDDDCDGQVDGGIAPVAITCGVGACATPGERTCEDGVFVDTCAPDLASAEVCNGIDDDCDGAVDEDVTPTPITCGTGACAAEGQSICVDGALVDACEPGSPTEESCNGLDDDCDGAVDDGLDPVEISCGEGACATPGEKVCQDGAWSDVCPAGVASAGGDTTCDGVDDDCDGIVDDDVVPEAITCGVGTCQAEGERVCQGGEWVEICDVAPSGVEQCNGADDDCDGDVDEDTNGIYYTVTQGSVSTTFAPVEGDTDVSSFYAYDAEVGTSTSGMNASNTTRMMLYRDPAGVLSLVATHDDVDDGSAGRMRMRIKGLYQGDITVHDDAPSKMDRYYYNKTKGKARLRWGWGGDGADGVVIEDVSDELCLRIIPRRPRGIQSIEIVDGALDGTPVSLDPTIAFRICAVTCCTPDAGGEICDGVDNDCDGEVDEDLTTEVTSCGLGPCAATGHSYCDGGVPVDTCTPGAPSSEDDASCNDVDDDCDGTVDDDFPVIPTTCGTGLCQGEGVVACEGGEIFDTCVALGTGGDEVCDGLDNDCDGDVDEQATGSHYVVSRGDVTVPITPLHSGTDVATFYSYDTTHSWSSDTGYEASERVTLMLHEDPSGDMGLVMLLDTPSDGTGGNVVFTFDGMDAADLAVLDDPGGQYDSWDPHTGSLVARWSSCCTDGVAFSDLGDDLCITIHPDWMQGLTGFDVITGDDGARVSLPDGDESVTICVVPCCEPDAGGEICDGVDNDCDGVVDEDQYGGPTSCGTGACAAEGDLICDGGAMIDTCTPGWPLSYDDATCDGIDDDCDGQVDEGFAAAATSCGEGVCANTGELTCEAGVVTDSCTPLLFESHTDDTCDGVDNDCDGVVDDDVQMESVTCGAGACASPGERFCVDGEPMDICEAPPTTDEVCNGLDDDCDGVADDDVTGSYFVLTQGDTSIPVSPIHSGTDLASFYSYNAPNHASANTGYEMSSRGTLLVHEDPEGTRSLVMIFDAANDGTGGRVEVNVSGLGGAGMTLLDDPSANHDSWDAEGGDLVLRWWSCCTDGAAFGPLDADGCVTVTPEVLVGIDGFDVLTGDGGDRVTLRSDLTPLTLCVAHCCEPGASGDGCAPTDDD